MRNTPHPITVTVLGFFLVTIGILFSVSLEEEFVIVEKQEDTYHILDDEILASSAVIYDFDEGRIVAGKNLFAPTSIASITKLFSGLIAFSYLSTSDTTEITEADFALTANTDIRLGERWNSIELLEYSLITSSNRGIHAVGRTIEEKTGKPIVELMNDFVQEHALVNTHFVNPTGLDVHNNLAGSESSALDLAKIAHIIVGQLSELAVVTTRPEGDFYSLGGTRHKAKNTNILLGSLEDTVLLSKTGYTDLADGALIMALQMKNGKRIGFVALNSTRTGRFSDMRTLINLYKTDFRKMAN